MQKDLQKSVQNLSLMQIFLQRKKENGTDAEIGAGEFAEPDVEAVQKHFADVGAEYRAEVGAESGAASAGRPVDRS